jgi:hypothetical protein
MKATMKRIKDEKRIRTPELRARLAPAGIHWEDLGHQGHLGFRRSGATGQWLARFYAGKGKYRQDVIAGAGDAEHAADGQRSSTTSRPAPGRSHGSRSSGTRPPDCRPPART